MVETVAQQPRRSAADRFRNAAMMSVIAWNVVVFGVAAAYLLTAMTEPDPDTADHVRRLTTMMVAIGFLASTSAGLLLAWLAAWLRRMWRAAEFRPGLAIFVGLCMANAGTFAIALVAFRLDG